MQFEFNLKAVDQARSGQVLTVGPRQVPIDLIRNPRARRYVLRVRPDGSARVTIPRGGSSAEARQFAQRSTGWLEQQFQRLAARPIRPKEWLIGTEILFRGELVKVEAGTGDGSIQFSSEALKVHEPAGDLRPAIERHLWRLAGKELPPRALGHAAAHQLQVRRVAVRNQKSRWGSCSRRGTISLNWRLIQAPAFVVDYIILHELMHLRQMNHSALFWREVARAFPDYKAAEHWLKQHSALLS